MDVMAPSKKELNFINLMCVKGQFCGTVYGVIAGLSIVVKDPFILLG